MKKIHMTANTQSRELVSKLIVDLQALNDSLLASDHLQKALPEEKHATSLIINRNNRIISKLQEEIGE
jgi:hypothetical protein